jgi:hypothetical protein
MDRKLRQNIKSIRRAKVRHAWHTETLGFIKFLDILEGKVNRHDLEQTKLERQIKQQRKSEQKLVWSDSC